MGLPKTVEELPFGGLWVTAGNGAAGAIEIHHLDMLVLAMGVKPVRST